ncbi:hypothetical protein OPW04_24085 [Vibrio europaeus]|uniref:Uncharacterized protein n=1 Tax=Vibrio europaeus TaxID=300876 RepID=A0AAE7AYL5_9VIBR|nr:hypothetical protein [Vibrio europaeus]MDC5807932.1 hypothetical protein [Vibrio europaeus]QJY38069.1 hypothetical protein HOO69_15925 [Vibrio europaeus]
MISLEDTPNTPLKWRAHSARLFEVIPVALGLSDTLGGCLTSNSLLKGRYERYLEG